MKNFLIVGGWFLSTLLTMVVCMTTLHFLKNPQQAKFLRALSSNRQSVILSPNSATVLGMSTTIEEGDARPILIAQFLESNASPLTPYDYWGVVLTQIADKYQMDFRLLPAIAMQESNLCKKIPQGSFNCLGLGIHSRGTWEFPSFESNFDKAAEILRKNYLNQGLITPDQIQDKYTPGSNGSWEFAVNHFMEELETADF